MKLPILLALLLSSALIAGCVTNNTYTDAETSTPRNEMGSEHPMNQGIKPGMGAGMHMMAPVTSEQVFIREMIPHHQEALDTALIVASSTKNPELRDLANAIIAAQEKEIVMMNSWLQDWYPAQTTAATYQPMMGDLNALDGEARDVSFLKGMIMHHEMAVIMANDLLKLEHRTETGELALAIISTQNSEIRQMKTLLDEDYAAS